ncbi:hypothetical protein JCM10213_001572 [Rhodosporidiobolus nylandii]
MSSDSRTILITGACRASRSLGLGYAKQLLASSPAVKIIAAARNPDKAAELVALSQEKGNEGRVYLLKLDVESEESAKAAAEELEKSGFLGPNGGLDALINNAGVCEHRDLEPTQLTKDVILANLGPNLFGVLTVTSAFLPLLRKGKGKQIFGVSSICGSLGGGYSDLSQNPAYCISKAAVNMYLRKLSRELAGEGFTVVMFHPGYVRTDMNLENGKQAGELTTEEAAKLATDNVFNKASPKDNGSFVQYDGQPMLW